MRLSRMISIAISIMSMFFIIAVSSVTQAKTSSAHAKHFYPSGTAIGITSKLTGQTLSVFINQKKVLQSIPGLQKSGYVDPNLSKAEVNFYQSLLPASISIHYVANIIKNIYLTHADLDALHIDAYLLIPDLYGNNTKSLCYSFDFNRKIYEKINWKKFLADNIKLIVPNFKTSDLCENLADTNPKNI